MHPTLRLRGAVLAGQAAAFLSRTLRLGGGTTLPGAIARRINPGTLTALTADLPGGVILLAGTNGKTTTSRMLAGTLEAGGHHVLHNRSGANLVEGLTAAAIAARDLRLQTRADTALFETDEAALPQALAETSPRLVLILNLFRDQLDRYGEVDTIAGGWATALRQLPPDATVLLNADDPAVATLGDGLAAQVCYYGIQDVRHAAGASAHIADARFCRRCGSPYTYHASFYAHLGHYTCPRCGHTRPEPHVRLERLYLRGLAGSTLLIASRQANFELRLPLPGLYNALNALAAAAAALLLDVPPPHVRTALEGFDAAFGRIERIATPAGKPMLVVLIKNPVGASETIRMLTSDTPPASLHMLIAINDLLADGTDVSWLWDAEFEGLAAYAAHVVVSGTRAEDMAVRLKYAGVEPGRVRVEPDLARAVDLALASLPAGQSLAVLPTYTAMLRLRAGLAARGWARPFWET